MKCHYEGKFDGLGCSGPVVTTLHDARGCVDVCIGHAQWRFQHSMAFGPSAHSTNCTHPEAKHHGK